MSKLLSCRNRHGACPCRHGAGARRRFSARDARQGDVRPRFTWTGCYLGDAWRRQPGWATRSPTRCCWCRTMSPGRAGLHDGRTHDRQSSTSRRGDRRPDRLRLPVRSVEFRGRYRRRGLRLHVEGRTGWSALPDSTPTRAPDQQDRFHSHVTGRVGYAVDHWLLLREGRRRLGQRPNTASRGPSPRQVGRPGIPFDFEGLEQPLRLDRGRRRRMGVLRRLVGELEYDYYDFGTHHRDVR